MPRHIPSPTTVPVPGGKRIEEYVGRVNSGTEAVSVARMTAPGGWEEPAQVPDFDEVTLVLRGTVRVEHDGGVLDVRAGEAVPASAPATARRIPPARTTWPSACPPSPRTPPTAKNESPTESFSCILLMLFGIINA